MKPREIFGLIIRVFGLILLPLSIWYLFAGIEMLVGIEDGNHTFTYVLDGVVLAVISAYFLRGAPLLLRFCYPKKADDAS
jgi:hypothetical protein